MRLVILHNHFRPGGVRRVIELAAPHLARALRPRVREIVLAAGEALEPAWWKYFQARLAPLPVACRIDPALRYAVEQRLRPRAMAARLQLFFDQLLAGQHDNESLVWAHNQGLGRNLLLTLAVQRACAKRGIPLVLHHHDWWFDNRWARWPEMRKAGFRNLAQVAEVIFAVRKPVRHAAINQADARVLQAQFPGQAAWLPNPLDSAPRPASTRVRVATSWLRRQLGGASPVWLMPCRLLRRKNIAEALLLTRWLRPEAWLVTTGGITSNEEKIYARRLAATARQHGWRLKLAILDGNESGKPAVAELLAASEAVLLTSLLEGFGLPYLEAAIARKPLLARALPNIAPDLAQLGFAFPHYYDDLLVAPELFDWTAEHQRQQRLFRDWRKQLPQSCRSLAGVPPLVSQRQPQPAPFSRLTLTAQLEVLARPAEASWERCSPLNPFLRVWRELARQGALRVAAVPGPALRRLSGPAYARHFRKLVETQSPHGVHDFASHEAQRELMRGKLESANLYPLLMQP